MAADDKFSKLSKQKRAMTMQFDAMQDAAEFLEQGGNLGDYGDEEYGDEEFDGDGPRGTAPPPLPPRSPGDPGDLAAAGPSPAPPPGKKSPLLYAGIAIFAITMAGLGIWVGNLLTAEDPIDPVVEEADGEFSIDLGEIEVTPH